MPSTDLSLQIKTPKLALAQQRFNQLLEKIELLTHQLAQTQAVADTFRPLYNRTLTPLQEQCDASLRETLRWLDARLQKQGLTPAMLRDTQAVVCHLSARLALAGDEDMRTLHDRNSPRSLADKENLAAEDHQALRQRLTEVDVSDLDGGGSAPGWLHAGRQRRRQQLLDAQAEKETTAHAGRHHKPRSAAQKKAHDQPQDAQGALRTIYRQLASALHPDREPHTLERARKTELMGQANAAYAQRNLMALLMLQLRCEQTDARVISRLTTEKMTVLTRLLKEQAAAVDDALYAAVSRVQDEFALSPLTPVTAAELAQALDEQALSLADAAALLQDDLRHLQTDTGLKRWIKMQKKGLKNTAWEAGF